MIVRVVVVAVDVGLFQVRSPREGGLLEAERTVHLLLELAVIGSICRRLHRQGHDYVVRVGVFISGAGIEAELLVLYVGEELLWRRRFTDPEVRVLGVVRQAAGVVEELSECDLAPRLRLLR
jgi:hypothetical protein